MTTNEMQLQLRCPRCDEQVWTITTAAGAMYAWRCEACGWQPTEN